MEFEVSKSDNHNKKVGICQSKLINRSCSQNLTVKIYQSQSHNQNQASLTKSKLELPINILKKLYLREVIHFIQVLLKFYRVKASLAS